MFEDKLKKYYNDSQITFIRRTTRIGAMMGNPSYATKKEIRDVLGGVLKEVEETIDDYVDRIYSKLMWEKKYVM